MDTTYPSHSKDMGALGSSGRVSHIVGAAGHLRRDL
jgi:hypothetical protein